MEQPTRPVEAPEETPEKTLGRRELLKALAAAGGAIATSSLLPGEWAKPVVEVGVLPAHAQVSEGRKGPVPGLYRSAARGLNSNSALCVNQDDTIVSSVDILPEIDGVRMRRTITTDDASHPHLPPDAWGFTDDHGHLDFPLFPIAGFTLPLGTVITVIYDFDDPNYPGLSDPGTQELTVGCD